MSDFEASVEQGSLTAAAIAAAALAERGHKTGTCANCTAPTIGAYCGVCGQERDTHRRSVWGLVKDLVEDIVSFDSRILRTAIALLVEPGEIPKAFREGRTQRYVPALRLYFFVSLVFFLVLSITGLAILQLEVVGKPDKVTRDARGHYYIANPAYDPSDPDMRNEKPLLEIPASKALEPGGPSTFNTQAHFFSRIGTYHSSLTQAQRDRLTTVKFDTVLAGKKVDPNSPDAKKAKAVEGWIKKNVFGGIGRLATDPASLNGPLTNWIPRVLFLLLPLYAVLLFCFYWRQHQKFYFVDHLIFSLTVHSFLFVVLIVDVGLAQFLSGGTVAWITMAALALYIFIAMRRFYEQSWFWTVVKFLGVSFIYTTFFLAPAIAGVLVLSFLGE